MIVFEFAKLPPKIKKITITKGPIISDIWTVGETEAIQRSMQIAANRKADNINKKTRNLSNGIVKPVIK